ncbi:MAG: hypothetical protein KF888_07990 [Nitrosomonas sp.]|nr:hypothetical protein [Nitrosomonas sp.]
MMPAHNNFGFSAGNTGKPECIAALPLARAIDNLRHARISCQPGADISATGIGRNEN